MLHKTDARQVTTTYAYDALNRVTTRSYSDPTPQAGYSYDTTGIANSVGRLTKVSSSVSVTSYAGYDALGQVTASSQATNGQTYSLSYEYDLVGNLTREIYPTGRIISHSFDTAGRLAQVAGMKQTTNTTYASALAYTAHGALRQTQLGNGIIEQTQFNSRLQPTTIKLGTTTNPSEKLQLSYDYGTTTNNGNIQSQSISVPGLTQPLIQSYQYDSLNRLSLARETNSGVQSWQQVYLYDRYGNRSLATGTTLPAVLNTQTNPGINAATNRFSDNEGYSYDDAGNMTAGGGLTYRYDAENRMVSSNYAAANQQATPNQYGYDGDGRRVRKVSANGQEVTVYVYNALGQMVAEYNNLPPASENQTSYLTSDTLGTPRVMTKADGSVKSRHDYLPFGEELPAGTGGRATTQAYVGSSDGVKQHFTGKVRDEETQLDYFEARYYSSIQGRFTSPDEFTGGAHEVSAAVLDPDPLLYAEPAEPQSFNKYSYCLNNPLRYVDPDGHQTEAADAIIQHLAVPKAAEVAGDIAVGITKSALNIGIGMSNVSADFGVGGTKHTEPYRASNKTQDYTMVVADDVFLLGGLLGSKSPAGVMTAETKETAVVASEVGNAERGTLVRGTKRGGAITEPNPAPTGTIVSEGGVKIERFPNDHGPAHLHVSGKGPNTRIGQNGRPLRNNPALSARQRGVVTNNLRTIRKTVGQAMKNQRYNGQ